MIYRAVLETRNFLFEGYGSTETEACDVLERAFAIHAKQYKTSVDWVDQFREEITVKAIKLGTSYRDGEAL